MKTQIMYMLYDPKGYEQPLTLHFQRHLSISIFFNKTEWKNAQKHKWTCRKVKVTIEEL
ncbi:hypothetical protein M2132_001787 [Dysgonomonas sp. PH5-45]|nr:hypothetical protein [Dysgonomonas sp. PH5-45]MDH6388341.1 hypothetical protein [Dysgonomonas sp. PH5-37]